MIIFFFDRFWNPLGKASATLPKGVTYYDDHEVEDVETGTSTFEVYVGFDEENRNIVRGYGQEATYFVTTDQEGHGRLWSVIDDESDEEAMFHYFYGEDAGMDLINEMLPAWGSPGSAKPIVYYIERAAADSGFEIGINEIPNLTRTLEWDGEATGLNRLQSIFTQFDNAELQFRFDIDENTLELKHKYIDILKKRGNDTGIELRMNREVKNIRMKRSRANMFNAYRCYGATPEGKENPITLNGYSLTTAQKEINPQTGKARFVLSGNILKDTESNAKYSRYLNPYEQGEDEGYYTGIYNSEATTQNALANETILQLKKTGYPEVNYEVDVIDAPRTLKAGDYVSIVNDKDELYLEGRILKTDRSRSNDTFEITLGDYLIRDSGIAEQIQAMADKLKGIVSSATTYQAGTSGTTPPTGTWSTSIPSVSENQYLWTKIVLTYSDNTNSTAYSVGKMGATGATGNGVKSTTINFASSTSGTTAPSSGWTTSIPTVAAGSFLWTRTVLTFTDNTTNTSYTLAKQGEKGDPTGIISQSTVPTNPYVGMLWRNTGTNNGYLLNGTYRWNGSAWEIYVFIAANISVENLAAIVSRIGEIYNDYSRTYNDNTTAIGTLSIKDAEINNSGVIRNSSGVVTQSYEQILSHQLLSMARYSGTALGDQNELIASASLSFDTLTLNDRENGFSGMIHARQLTDTPWINLPYAAGFRTSENNPCQYQVSYNMKGKRTITFRGQVERTSGAMTGTTYPFGIGTVPASIRPTENTFKLAAGDATELQTVRVGMLGTAQPSIGNSIQIKVVGNSQYVDISALTYDIP